MDNSTSIAAVEMDGTVVPVIEFVIFVSFVCYTAYNLVWFVYRQGDLRVDGSIVSRQSI
jgi:hypothetical protein